MSNLLERLRCIANGESRTSAIVILADRGGSLSRFPSSIAHQLSHQLHCSSACWTQHEVRIDLYTALRPVAACHLKPRKLDLRVCYRWLRSDRPPSFRTRTISTTRHMPHFFFLFMSKLISPRKLAWSYILFAKWGYLLRRRKPR
jgi:hypothetical protein